MKWSTRYIYRAGDGFYGDLLVHHSELGLQENVLDRASVRVFLALG